MATAFADLQDVLDIWEDPLSAAQQRMIESRLREASAKIRYDTGLVSGLTVDARMALDETFAEVVKNICRNMVHRLLLNPRARETIAIDDGSVRLSASISSGQMYITDDEMRSLSASSEAGATGGAFTIRPRGWRADTGVYAPLPVGWLNRWH